MAECFVFSSKKRSGTDEFDGGDDLYKAKKSMLSREDPAAALASASHEFGEHGGVNMSIEASATFSVMEPETKRRMFAGELGTLEKKWSLFERALSRMQDSGLFKN